MDGNRMSGEVKLAQDERAGTGHFASAPAYPPIEEYAFLSDCETTALIAPSGNVEWLCLKQMDSPSVFGAILDRDAGGFRLGPSDVTVPVSRRYLPGTMILETTWQTDTGWINVRDVMLIGPWRHDKDRSHSQRRAPADYDAEHVLLRTVRCVQGHVQVSLDCEPVFEYGQILGSWEFTEDGYLQAQCRADGTTQSVTLTSDINLGLEGPRALGRTMIKDGETRFVALSWHTGQPPRTYDEAERRLIWTAHHWQHWLGRGTFPDHPWRSILQRAALTLKGLTYAPTGAIVAAPTTSLPETRGGERNWDYRYSWLRDSTFALWGLHTLGFNWEANDYLHFLADVAGTEGELQVMYTVDGGPVPDERTLDHLHGYEGARPVRIGNAAHGQRQHDVWGVMLDSVYLHARRESLDERIWPILVRQVEAALSYWREPDRGIWEVRGEPKHFTSSKVMCWVAADRGAKLARLREEAELAERWQAAADEIRADICTHALDKRGVFTQHYDSDALDASLLLMPLVGFLPPSDERIRRTVLAIADELTDDGFVRRYRVDQTDDGLSGDEGTFTICSFWLVSALVEIGEWDRARRLCERLLKNASSLGLYGEELDPETGRHLGNFPQAFTHLALINAVVHVIQAEQRGAEASQPRREPQPMAEQVPAPLSGDGPAVPILPHSP